MARWLCLFAAMMTLVPAGCADKGAPDRREARVPEEEERYPGLEVNPPDVYEYMREPPDAEDAPEPPPPRTAPPGEHPRFQQRLHRQAP